MAFNDQSDDELYRRDISKLRFAKQFDPTARNKNTEKSRQDSAFADGSVHHDVAGTIFLRRKQSCSVTTEQPVPNSATAVCLEIDDGNDVMGISGAADRRPSYTPAAHRITFTNATESIFLRRRSVSTPPEQIIRNDSSLSDSESRSDASESSTDQSKTECSSPGDGKDTLESPGCSSSPLSEPPPSPPLHSVEWLAREQTRDHYAEIELARMVRVQYENAQERKRAREAETTSKEKQYYLADTLSRRGVELQNVNSSISWDKWPYTVPPLNRRLRDQLSENVALLHAYLEQELELRQVIHGRLNSIEELGFLSERDLSEEKRYLLVQLHIREADRTNSEDVWGHYLVQQITKMKGELRSILAVGVLDESGSCQLDAPTELVPDLVVTANQFPKLEARVREWQRVKFEVISRPMALENELRRASTTQLSEPELQSVRVSQSSPTISETGPHKTPGGRIIPIRQPIQPPCVEGVGRSPGKWLKRTPARPLTPPDELFLKTTASAEEVASAEAVSSEQVKPARRRRARPFILYSDSDSTDSDQVLDSKTQQTQPRQFVESDIDPPEFTENVKLASRRHKARQSLETVVELPESTERAEGESAETLEAPLSPGLQPTQAEKLDDDLKEYTEDINVSSQELGPRQPVESNMDLEEFTENSEPTPRIPQVSRVSSLTSMLNCRPNRQSEPRPLPQSRLSVPRVLPPILIRRPNTFAPTSMPGHSPPVALPSLSSSSTSRIDSLPPSTPMNSPSPALSNDVTDEGPIPSRLVARLETEQNRRDGSRLRVRWVDGVNEESFDSMDRVAEWSDQRGEVEVENETDDWLWSVD